MPADECLEMMIRAASFAPSASNSQPVRFIRIISEDVRIALHDRLIQGRARFLDALGQESGTKRVKNVINSYYRYSEFMFKAPVILAVGTIKGYTGFSGKLSEAGLVEKYDQKELDIAVGLALKGFILKGQELGLGSCVLTAPLVFIPDAGAILGPFDLDIRCFTTVGFPDEVPAFLERKAVKDIYRVV
jgi:nitroreductase